MIGLVSAAALLLVAAGVGKLRPAVGPSSPFAAARIPLLRRLPPALAARGSALVEALLGACAFALGGRLGAGLVLAGFAVLAGLSARMMALESGQDCACFARPSPITHWHTAVNLACAAAGAAGLLLPAPSLPC